MISVPFQNNLTPGMGPNGDHTLNVLNIQPAAVAVYSKGPWVAGALLNNVWSFAGDSDRRAVGGGVGRVFRIGRQPINASLQDEVCKNPIRSSAFPALGFRRFPHQSP